MNAITISKIRYSAVVFEIVSPAIVSKPHKIVAQSAPFESLLSEIALDSPLMLRNSSPINLDRTLWNGAQENKSLM